MLTYEQIRDSGDYLIEVATNAAADQSDDDWRYVGSAACNAYDAAMRHAYYALGLRPADPNQSPPRPEGANFGPAVAAAIAAILSGDREAIKGAGLWLARVS